ncbi:MAG: hypothetical protein WBW84_19215 [Acidobacteriaceae bacterium]
MSRKFFLCGGYQAVIVSSLKRRWIIELACLDGVGRIVSPQRVLEPLNREHKDIPALRHGSDAIVAQVAAQHRDIAEQAAVGDESVGPDTADEGFLMDEVPGLAHQHVQKLEFFGRQRDRFARACQCRLGPIKDEGAESEPHSRLLILFHNLSPEDVTSKKS